MRRKTLDKPAGPSLASLTFEHASVESQSRYGTMPVRSALRKSRAYTAPALRPPYPELDSGAAEDLDGPIDNAHRSMFDTMLPRELKLSVLSAFVTLHEAEHEEQVRQGSWTVVKAGRQRYIGRDKGVKELLRLSLVRGVSI